MHYYGHDDGSGDPLTVTPLPARDSKFLKLMVWLGRRERNALDERRQAAAKANLSFHEIQQRTMAALARIGGGGR
jgi:hypothetical protein